MESIKVTTENTGIEFNDARLAAVGKAGKSLSKPVIIAWKDDNSGRFAPRIPGAASDRWHDYGVSNGVKLELTVGDAFHFIFSEAADFDAAGMGCRGLYQQSRTTAGSALQW